MSTYIVLFLLVIFALAILAELGSPATPPLAARPLMTANEIRFWRLLRPAAAPLHVAPQVAMGALLKVARGTDRRARLGARNRFDRKVVDFALVDDDGQVQLLVELDDRTHNLESDRVRDRMTGQAGYRTLRAQGVVARDARLLRDAIDDMLGREGAWSPPTIDAQRYARRRSSASET